MANVRNNKDIYYEPVTHVNAYRKRRDAEDLVISQDQRRSDTWRMTKREERSSERTRYRSTSPTRSRHRYSSPKRRRSRSPPHRHRYSSSSHHGYSTPRRRHQ